MTPIAPLKRFARAKSGLAAVEFAIMLPMMVFLMFGSVDLIDLLGANKRSQNVAASLADVVARDTEISNAEVDGLWSASDILMFPSTTTGMKLRVTSVSVQSPTSAVVTWSEAHGGLAPLGQNSTVTLPAGMMQPGTSIIMTESIYNYSTPLGILSAGQMLLTHTAYRRSRLVDPIPRIP